MNELDQRFESAVCRVRDLTTRPNDDQLLEIYALFKQSTVGDVSGGRPGALRMVARAKWEAWARLDGLDQIEARKRYIQLVDSLS